MPVQQETAFVEEENKKKNIGSWKVSSIHRFHVTSQCFIAALFVYESQPRDLSVYDHSSHNYQRKINETLPEGSQGLQYTRYM